MKRVKECITEEVVSIAPEATAKTAFGMLKAMRIRHLVVERDGRVLGIVTDRDLRRPELSDIFKSWDQLYRISDEFQVEDIMTSPVITIADDADIREAAKLMVVHRIGALPVVTARGTLAGIITETDLLKELISTADR
jgi:acetoin utilization protein AcuB